jgi:hypothetical protein
MRRISNRRYPTTTCKNPACEIEFEPHDRRQEYCEPQRRINANNDKRHFENNSRFSDEKQTRLNNKILASAWEKLKNKKEKHVARINLEWDKFNFQTQASIKKNTKTGRNILWYHDYGLELIDPAGTLFEIHKKQ